MKQCCEGTRCMWAEPWQDSAPDRVSLPTVPDAPLAHHSLALCLGMWWDVNILGPPCAQPRARPGFSCIARWVWLEQSGWE